ncbi:MAG: Nif3-like dinuclear metal center hexameric protein [Planctomycetota bacterium]
MHRDELGRILDGWLHPADFDDGAENGLQVEGRDEIRRVVLGVTANQDLIQAAIEAEADAVVVHHGLIWGGGLRRLSGWQGRRVSNLFRHEISLFAYHLPLDAHPELGNNAGLADALGLTAARHPFGTYRGHRIGLAGEIEGPVPFAALLERIRENVGEPVFAFGEADRTVRRVAVCSGGAADLFQEAIDEGVDLYVTGEGAEWAQALARECGTAFVAAGHHATEHFGVRRLTERLAGLGGIEARFVDVPNPA